MASLPAMTAGAGLGWTAAAVALALAAWGTAVLAARWRRRRFAEYDFEVRAFDLPLDGPVRYAQWLHPKETPKRVSQAEVTALRHYIRPGDTVIDIGAHTGDTTIHFALAAGAEGCTLALEPNPYVFKVLAENAALNRDKTHIVPLNFAATEQDGFYTFHYSDGAYCNGGYLDQIADTRHGHRQPLEVVGRNLESYLRPRYRDRLARLSLIKIDTEGYDRQVLLSIASLVREFQPVIVCEVYRRLNRTERETLVDLLHGLGYHCFHLSANAELRGEPVERERLGTANFDIISLPRTRRKLHYA